MTHEGRPHGGPRTRDEMEIVRLVRDVTARVVHLGEALDAGDFELARDIARDLEDELAKGTPRTSTRCPVCGLDCRWPGLVVKHVAIVHPKAVEQAA